MKLGHQEARITEYPGAAVATVVEWSRSFGPPPAKDGKFGDARAGNSFTRANKTSLPQGLPSNCFTINATTVAAPLELRAWLKSLPTRESPEGELDGGQGDEGEQGVGEVLVVLGETPVAAKPGEGALDDPATRQDDEAGHVVAPFDDLDPEGGNLGGGLIDLSGVVASVGPDQFEPWEAVADLIEHQAGTVAILDAGGVDDDPHRQPEGIDQGVDLAALHLLAGVVAHRAVVAAPFSADFSDWLSRTAALGLASRPCRSRSAMCSSAQIASQTPSRWKARKML